MLERISGATRERDASASPSTIHAARTGILVWTMGITQHAFGVDNVQGDRQSGALAGLARQGALRRRADPRPQRRAGRRGDGRVPNALPGGEPVNAENAPRFAASCGASRCRTWPGLHGGAR